MKTRFFQLVFSLSFTVFTNTAGMAQDIPNPKPTTEIPASKELEVKNDSIPTQEVKRIETDSIVNDSLQNQKNYWKPLLPTRPKTILLSIKKHNKYIFIIEAEIQYKDMDIKAGVIVIDYGKDIVYAGRLKDSLGNYSQHPVFKQGSDVVEPDSIAFNLKTKKALIWNSKTEQQGGRIISDLTKKENDSVYFVKRAKFTTSENIENPEYYFLLRKAKIVPGKKVVTGLTNLFIADVPTPIGLPFAFFPLSQTRTSGVSLSFFWRSKEIADIFFKMEGIILRSVIILTLQRLGITIQMGVMEFASKVIMPCVINLEVR